MAEAQLCGLQDEFTCSLCLDTLTDPVSIPCGHNFCLKCLTDCWDQSQEFSCPQCREMFNLRPPLRRNTVLNEIVEKLKKTGLSSSPSQKYAGPGEVECDACTGKKFRAVKSCLTCLASFCQTHLQPHYEGDALTHHKLTDPDGNLKEKLCAKHQKSLEIFCKTDDLCICMMCVVTGHKGHETVELETEREGKEKQLGATWREIRRRLEEREKKMKEMRNVVEQIKISVEKEVKENEKCFTDLIHCIEEAQKNLFERIREQEKREIEKAEGVMERLEKEIEELKKRDTELKEMFDNKDHVHFMQTFSSRCVLPADGVSLSFTVSADFSFEDLRNELSCLKKSLEKIIQWDIQTSSGKKLLEVIDTRNEPTVSDPRAKDLHETHRQAVSESTRTLGAQASPGDPHTTAVGFETRYTELVAVEHDPRNHKETEHELMKTVRIHEELMEEGAAEKCERIRIEQLFKKSPVSVNPVNIIVVSGMAGIGKTTMVQKIMYDWARGTEYQRFAFVFLFKFRELNLLDNENEPQMSLTKLIERHYKYLSNERLKEILQKTETLLFIFDGLDEYKHKLDFTQSQLCSNPDVEVPVHILFTSLVRRTLLKGCSVLITSRPAALEAVDMERVDQFVEILGFFPEQRLMYCKKFFGDTALAAYAFQYVKENTILNSMCFIPSYCWMICSLLRSHFMTPENAKSEALQVSPWLCVTQNKELIRDTIGKDLKMNFSSMTLSAVDCAVLATVISCCGELKELDLSETPLTPESIKILEPGLSCCNVVRLVSCGLTIRCCSALSSVLSAPNSQLTDLRLSYNNNMEDSGVEQLCEGLRSPNCKLETLWLDSCSLTSACCSALSSVLSSPNSRLTYLNLDENNNLGDSGARQLSEGLRSDNCKLKELWLWSCGLTSACCSALSSVLLSPNSRLTVLVLNDNKLKDSGARQLSEGLRSHNCKLETLGLDSCGLTSACCSALSSVLSSPNSRLTFLNLDNNNLRDLGARQLSEGIRSDNCKLETLGLLSCGLTSACCSALSSVLSSPNSRLTYLNLNTNNNLGDSGAHQLCEGLRSDNCKLVTLRLQNNEISESEESNLRSVEEELRRSGRQLTIIT
uniref:NACHT, LRR and PYD domains-containing protein 3-like n=1 Tax=Erpetoichthys calabaricus TaxID=27687 RepID=A0A8C4TP88_ERPCA